MSAENGRSFTLPGWLGGSDDRDTGTTGDRGEEAAAAFLEKKGFVILARNYRRRFGEIDIVAQEKGVLVFVEVKTRRSNRYGNPFEAVDERKQRKLSRMALDFISSRGLHDQPARFDVVAVHLQSSSSPVIEHLPNAFDFQD